MFSLTSDMYTAQCCMYLLQAEHATPLRNHLKKGIFFAAQNI